MSENALLEQQKECQMSIELTLSFSRKHKFIYLAPQRTGSRSIKPVLQKYCEMETWMSDVEISGRTIIHDWVETDEFKDYDVLTSCRNPYSRAVSLFKWRQGAGQFPIDLFDGSKYIRSVSRFLGDARSRIKYLIRLEHLADDLRKVPGVPANAELPQFDPTGNPYKTEGLLWEQFYNNAAARDQIYEAYKDDFENFDYLQDSCPILEQAIRV